MVPKIFFNRKTAKKDRNVTNIREINMGAVRYQCTFSLFLIFQSIIKIIL